MENSDNSVELTLKDYDTNEEYKLLLSPSSARRVETDLTFATSLLNAARESCMQASNASPAIAPGFTEENSLTDQTSDNANIDLAEEAETEGGAISEDKENFRWSDTAILLLVEEYRPLEPSMSSGKLSHEKAWMEISKIMKERGYNVSDRKCMTRINTMKRTYKSIKDHNGRSGNNKRTWKFYENMESLLGEKPYMAPLKTISSTGTSTSSRERSESPCSSGSGSCSQSGGVSRKRKPSDAIGKLLEARERAEERKEKRHRERMALQSKISEEIGHTLKKIVERFLIRYIFIFVIE